MAGTIGRGTLPQNFLDSVTADLSLPTPEPQYFFAKMAMAGRLSAAAIDAGAPTAQQFVSMAGSGAPVSPQLDEMARAADAYPGAITTVDRFGLGRGDTIKLPRDVFAGGGYDEASRELKTDASISTTGQTVQTEEVAIVLKEFIGPFNTAGAAVQPYALWDFDTKYRANKRKLADLVTKHLRRDYTKWLDRVIRGLFLRSSNFTLPAGITDASSFIAGGAANISMEQIFAARKKISDREWQKFANGRYMCLVPTTFNTQMVSDPDYKELSKYHDVGRNLLFGYIGSVQDVDFFECTTLAHYSDNGGDDIATYNGVSVGPGVVLDEAILLGPGAVGMGTALAPECRWADDTNFGTLAKVIWYALHAFQLLDERGVEKILFQGVDA